MKSDDELMLAQHTARLQASSGGAVPASTPLSRAIVVEDDDDNATVQRRWLIGDPWGNPDGKRYFFAPWRADNE